MTGKTGNRLSMETRKNLVAFAVDLIAAGNGRDVVVPLVVQKFGLKNNMSAAVTLSRNGVKFPEACQITAARRRADEKAAKLLAEIEKAPAIFETSDHLYYRAARRLVEEGINASVDNGICLIDGQPVPWRRFVVDLAGLDLPQ